MGTGLVSRNKLSRRKKSVMVQDFNCVQLWVCGCNGIANLSWVQERFAKTVTSNLPILSVLAQVYIFGYCPGCVFNIQSVSYEDYKSRNKSKLRAWKQSRNYKDQSWSNKIFFQSILLIKGIRFQLTSLSM
jgi:hypothetical protein